MGDAEIVEYLTHYGATLTSFDATAAAELWSTPGLIVDDRTSGVLGSRDEIVQGLERAYPLYRALGLASVGFELLGWERLSGALVLVRVRWLFHDDHRRLMTDSTSSYILRHGDGGFHACVAIQVDDAEKLRALAAERGIDLPDVVPEPGPPST